VLLKSSEDGERLAATSGTAKLLFVAAAGAALLFAVTALADADPWPAARGSLSYPLYRPT
jgi:hypothetical protein